MGHLELRHPDDEDLDAVFEMMRDPAAVELAAFTADDPDDRDAFDRWIARIRGDDDVTYRIVTEDGAFAGAVGSFTVDGEREVTY